MYLIKYPHITFKAKSMGLMVACLLGCQGLKAQSTVPLGDLSFFQEPSANWKLAANVHADLGENEALLTKEGTGILINTAGTKNARDLYTKATYGDMDLELDYMMAKGSNSGIYLQGRYEIQLLDSWGTVNPKSGDNGGIYERWDESKPDGQKGYDGHAPRQKCQQGPRFVAAYQNLFPGPTF